MLPFLQMAYIFIDNYLVLSFKLINKSQYTFSPQQFDQIVPKEKAQVFRLEFLKNIPFFRPKECDPLLSGYF